MAKQKDEKTNVMRILDQKEIPYTPHTYPHEEGEAVDGVTVAGIMGQDPECVFKTLVARGRPVPCMSLTSRWPTAWT